MDEKTSILIADDDESICRYLSCILRKKGYETETAGTGQEALEKLQERSFNMALLDIMLPDVEGLELVAPLKKMSPDMAVIIVTGHACVGSAVRALTEGASAYLTKPLNVDEVLATVNEALEKQRLVRDKRRMEEALRRAHDELEARVEQRTADLRAANEQLQREIVERKRMEKELYIAKEAAENANRAKRDFLASMSHELHTPLNAILGFAQVLQEPYFGELKEEQAEYVNDILEGATHLLSLIDDILDFSKIETDKLELKLSRVNIGNLLQSSITVIKEKCFRRGIHVSLDIGQDLEIIADERRVKQIMFNLLSNAAKFTPDGGRIGVEAKLVSHSKGDEWEPAIEVRVSDTGIGIAGEDRERIFEGFYQVRSGLTGKTPGAGLGLSVTKRLVEMHGGRIWVESEGEGKGSCFSFAIPVQGTDQD